MFDTTQTIHITLKTPTGKKEVIVDFPSTDQWKARAGKIKIVSKPLGRGKSTTDVLNYEKANAELFDQIVKNEVELDEYEKSQVIERLQKNEVIETEETDTGYSVTLKVPGGETKHDLKMPSAKQVSEYQPLIARSGQRGLSEFTTNLSAPESLYDALIQRAEGYQGDVPVVHKSAVIGEVIALYKDDGGDEIEGF